MSTRVENGIRRCRQQESLTLRQLAEELGVDASTLSKWETGSSVPDLFKVKLARRFRLPVHHLFFFDSVRETADL